MTEDEMAKKDREAIRNGGIIPALRKSSRAFNVRLANERTEETAAREEHAVDETVPPMMQIRAHRGSRDASYATMESIPFTREAILQFLTKHYGMILNYDAITCELYARGARKIDWDYIYTLECEYGVLAFVDRKIP